MSARDTQRSRVYAAEQFVTWDRKWDRVSNCDFNEVDIRWFEGARLNVAYNCVDRHLATHGDRVAILWEGDSPDEHREVTYRELHESVCRFANALKARGVPFAFASGYGAAGVESDHRDAPVLQKPFRQIDLERALTALVSG